MSRTKLHQQYISPVTGKPVPGATTIINNLGWNTYVLMRWAASEVEKGHDPFKKRDKAASIGTLAHALIEEHYGEEWDHIEPRPVDRDEFPPEDLEKAENAYLAYLEWEGGHDIEVISSEEQLPHPELLYGGTIDMLCRMDGEPAIVDFKTSNGVYNEHVIQLAAYRELVIAHRGDEWFEAPTFILHLSKEDGRFTPHKFKPKDMQVPWKAFKNCLDLHYIKKEMPL